MSMGSEKVDVFGRLTEDEIARECQRLYESGELRRLASAGNVDAQYNLAFQLAVLGHSGAETASAPQGKLFQQSFHWYVRAAKQGHVDAQHNLAICFYHGIGVEKNDRKFKKWMWAAARAGDTDSMAKLGVYYYNHREFDEAVPLLTQAAEKDEATACVLLGNCYQDGAGVEKNLVKAARMYVKGGAHEGGADPSSPQAEAAKKLAELRKRVEGNNFIPEIKRAVRELATPAIAAFPIRSLPKAAAAESAVPSHP